MRLISAHPSLGGRFHVYFLKFQIHSRFSVSCPSRQLSECNTDEQCIYNVSYITWYFTLICDFTTCVTYLMLSLWPQWCHSSDAVFCWCKCAWDSEHGTSYFKTCEEILAAVIPTWHDSAFNLFVKIRPGFQRSWETVYKSNKPRFIHNRTENISKCLNHFTIHELFCQFWTW